MPSLTYETFGIIIIEAFARKTPVIVRDLGALPEVVNDSGGGFTYGTDEELLLAINKLATDTSLRDSLGEKGYQAFLKHWSTEAHMKLYFGFLDAIAKKKFGFIPWEIDNEKKANEVPEKVRGFPVL